MHMSIATRSRRVGDLPSDVLADLEENPEITVDERRLLLQRDPPCGKLGDVNNDGTVDVNDVTAANGIIKFGQEARWWANRDRADLNNTGTVTNEDVAMLWEYVQGGIDTFPACSLRNRVDIDRNTLATVAAGALPLVSVGAIQLIRR